MSTKKKTAAQLKREQAAKDKKRSKADAKAFACVYSYSPAHAAAWQGVVRIQSGLTKCGDDAHAMLLYVTKDNVDMPALRINEIEALFTLIGDLMHISEQWKAHAVLVSQQTVASLPAREDAETAKLRKLYPEKHTPKLPAMADAGGAA